MHPMNTITCSCHLKGPTTCCFLGRFFGSHVLPKINRTPWAQEAVFQSKLQTPQSASPLHKVRCAHCVAALHLSPTRQCACRLACPSCEAASPAHDAPQRLVSPHDFWALLVPVFSLCCPQSV